MVEWVEFSKEELKGGERATRNMEKGVHVDRDTKQENRAQKGDDTHRDHCPCEGKARENQG